MSANEFEKQVQKQLDDFQLNPSASVWKKVEEQIRKKKRKRALVFFLLPVLLGLLSYSVYHFLYTNKKAEQVQQPVVAKKDNSSVADKNNIPEAKEQSFNSTTKEKNRSNELRETRPGQKIRGAGKNETEFQTLSNGPSTRHRKNKPAVIEENKGAVIQKKTGSPVPNINVQTKNEVVVMTDKPETGRITKDRIDEQPLTANDQTKKVVVNSDVPVPAKADSAKTEEVVKVINKTIIKRKFGGPKIKWGIDFSAGIASNQNQVFSFSKSSDVRAAYGNNSPGAITSFPGAAVTLPPSSVKPGVALRVGIVGEVRISTRSKVSMGLQYAYASNRIKTGTADRALLFSLNSNLSAMVDQVYRGPQENSYTNSYHFISIPVTWHWQINTGKKLPVQWNIGISPGYLVATDALVYSSSNGGSYYYDKQAINKFHFSVGTGLSFRLNRKRGMEYILGPEISVDTRKLINSTYEGKQYPVYWGVGARLLLPRGKNK